MREIIIILIILILCNLSTICENFNLFKPKPENVYIYAFPDVFKQKNYRLKAKMIYNKWIRIYFNNGGSILFDDCDEMYSNGDFFNCYSSEKDERWYFRYYGEKR